MKKIYNKPAIRTRLIALNKILSGSDGVTSGGTGTEGAHTESKSLIFVGSDFSDE